MLVAGEGSSVNTAGMQKNLGHWTMMRVTDLSSTDSGTSVLNKVSENKEPSSDSGPGAAVVNKSYSLLPLKFQSRGNPGIHLNNPQNPLEITELLCCHAAAVDRTNLCVTQSLEVIDLSPHS
jgi:hypothetical protein